MTDVNPTSKICRRCGIDKKLEDYTAQKYGKYGRTSMCRPCCNARNKVFRDKKSPPELRPVRVARELLAKGLTVVIPTTIHGLFVKPSTPFVAA